MNDGEKKEKWDEARWADIDRELRAFGRRPSDQETIALYMKHGMSEALAHRAIYRGSVRELTDEAADAEAAKGGFTEYLKAARQHEKERRESRESA